MARSVSCLSFGLLKYFKTTNPQSLLKNHKIVNIDAKEKKRVHLPIPQ